MSNTINFGIDLGTTNSLIAKFNKGTVNVFKNPVGWKETLPSVVAFRNERILVGEKAREYFKQNPKSCAAQFKRKMGTTETFPVGAGKDPKTPVELSAQVLKELKGFVTDGEKVEDAVITVPASFDVTQCAATTEAAKVAGITNVVLLNEPIAASLAYANQTGGGSTEGKWLVYDLGGGTFDVALVEISSGEMRIIDHEGDNFLGGVDFDLLIVERLIVPYLESKGYEIDFAQDMRASSGVYNKEFYAFLIRAEEAKKELSTNTSALIEFDFEDEFHELEILRSDFEPLIKPSVTKTVDMIRRIMTNNSLRPSDLNFMLMVGGSTYIPYIRKVVEEQAGVPIKTDIDPTTAIGIGAAFYAGTKERASLSSKDAVHNSRNIEIRAVYSKTSKEAEELFSARVTGNIAGLFYRVQREDGGFDSGLLQLTERITMDLPLVSDSYNNFTFKVIDEQGDEIQTNFSEIAIAQNLVSVYGQPIPHDISIELDDMDKGTTYLRTIFRKSTILPTKSSVQTVKTTRNVPKNSTDQALFIFVKEGPSDYLPEALDSVGTLRINGSSLKRDLLKGSDVEITLEMSESRDITVSAYIPFLDQSFKEVFSYRERNIDVEILRSEVDSLDERISEAIDDCLEESKDLKSALERLRGRLADLQSAVWDLPEDDATDAKFKLQGDLREIAQEFNFAQKLGEDDRALDDYRSAKHWCDRIVHEDGNPRELELYAEIIKDEDAISNPPSVPHLVAKKKDLWSLYWRIRIKQPSYWTAEFNRLVEEEGWNPSPAKQQLIKDGKLAVANQDYSRLESIVRKLGDARPPAVGPDRTITGIG
jgi:molecular chaperone DnaK